MYFTLLVWDAESLWITLWKVKLLLSQAVTPFIWRLLITWTLLLLWLCSDTFPFCQPMHMQGSHKITPSGNTSQQSTSSRDKSIHQLKLSSPDTTETQLLSLNCNKPKWTGHGEWSPWPKPSGELRAHICKGTQDIHTQTSEQVALRVPTRKS